MSEKKQKKEEPGSGYLIERPHSDREPELEGSFTVELKMSVDELKKRLESNKEKTLSFSRKLPLAGWIHFDSDGRISITIEERERK